MDSTLSQFLSGNSLDNMDLLTSLTILAKANAQTRAMEAAASVMATSPRSDASTKELFNFSCTPTNKKRSINDILESQEYCTFPSLTNLSSAKRMKSVPHTYSSGESLGDLSTALQTSSSQLINLLLVQNALKQGFSSPSPRMSSLFDDVAASQSCSSRRSSAVSTTSAFSYDMGSDSETASLNGSNETANAKSCEDGDGSRRKSAYRGVIWDKNSRAWRAKLSVKGKLMHVGLFEDEKEAAIAWDKKAIEVRGHKTRLNFPELVQDLYRIELTSRRIRKRV